MSAPKRRTVVQMVALVVVVGLLALFAYGLRLQGSGPVDSGDAPTFTLPLFDGGSISLADLRGKVVVINFWASWCPPCREEAATLEKTWRAYKDRGVVFIGVDYMDTEPEARAYMKEFDVTYPNGPDLGTKIARAYRIRGVPETFFVNKEGKIAQVQIGPITESKLVGIIERLLKE
jgi:cytochrome c biogenesis protein CcmG/thiol:disulfide interchange protein DsbE